MARECGEYHTVVVDTMLHFTAGGYHHRGQLAAENANGYEEKKASHRRFGRRVWSSDNLSASVRPFPQPLEPRHSRFFESGQRLDRLLRQEAGVPLARAKELRPNQTDASRPQPARRGPVAGHANGNQSM